MSTSGLPRDLITAAVVLTAYAVFKALRAGALSNSRNARKWVAAGACHGVALAYFVRTGIALAWPLAIILILVWATPLVSLLLFRSQRLLLRTRLAINHGELRRAESLLEAAGEAVNQSSPVDLEWNRIQYCELEGRLRIAEGRLAEAIPPLRESFLRACEFGITCYVHDSAKLLIDCYCALEQWEDAGEIRGQIGRFGISLDLPARRVSDSAASTPGEPADTISPRSL
ncbi:MAG: hypothetical protein SFV51_09005 [Bryobacteraceae bacterium]|nr:hypothetical protein [Bryobacteraceae bacterium]